MAGGERVKPIEERPFQSNWGQVRSQELPYGKSRSDGTMPVGARPLVASLGTYINISRPNSSDLLVSDLSPIKPRHSFTSFTNSPIDGPDGGYRHDPFVGDRSDIHPFFEGSA